MKSIALFLGLLIIAVLYPSPAFGGGRFSFGIGSAPFFGPGAAFSFHHRRSKSHFFFQFGHRPFGHFRGAPGPRGYYYLPPIDLRYPIAPHEIPWRGFSGTDPNGALFVDGYRVIPSGWLRVQVEPADSQVLIDGFPVAINQASRTSVSVGLPVGSHQVEVLKAGFQKYQSEVEVKQARKIFLRVKLEQ